MTIILTTVIIIEKLAISVLDSIWRAIYLSTPLGKRREFMNVGMFYWKFLVGVAASERLRCNIFNYSHVNAGQKGVQVVRRSLLRNNCIGTYLCSIVILISLILYYFFTIFYLVYFRLAIRIVSIRSDTIKLERVYKHFSLFPIGFKGLSSLVADGR